MISFMQQYGARLVDNGYSVIPIMPGHKKPGRFIKGQWENYPDWSRHCERPTKGFEVAIWDKWPGCAIGLAGGRLAGIDLDLLDAAVASQIEALARRMLGDTPAKRIGRAPKCMLVYRTSAPFDGFKKHPIEVLCRGQQFVAYAVHPDTGNPYEWPDESLVDLDWSDLPEITEEQARAFVIEAFKLVPEHLRPATLNGHQTDGIAVPNGSLRGTVEAIRSALDAIPNYDLDYDSWINIGLALKGALGDQGQDLFAAWSSRSAKDQPDYTASKWPTFRPTSIGAGTIYHHAEMHGWVCPSDLTMNGDLPMDDRHPAAELLTTIRTLPVVVSKSYTVPSDLLDIDGGLRLLVDWIVSTANRPQPFLALGAAMTAFGVLTARRYRSPSNLRGNLYVLGIADSGGGKDHARACIKEAFYAAGLSKYLGGNKLASGQAVLGALYRHPAGLFQIDEFGHFLAGVLHRKAPPHKMEIWSNLTELYTSAGGIFQGTEYADQKEKPRQDIAQPCACVNGTTVPTTFWAALEGASVIDGSLARFLIFRAQDDYPAQRKNPPLIDPPADLVASLQSVAAGCPDHDYGDLGGLMSPNVSPTPYTVPMTAAAERLSNDLADEQDRWLRDVAGTPTTAVIGRMRENAIKLALIRAVARHPSGPTISGPDLEWATALVQHCIRTMLDEADRFVSDNDIERRHKRVLDMIRKAGTEGLTKNELTRRTQFMTGRERGEVLAALVESQQITAVQVATDGRPAVRYVMSLIKG